MQISGVMNISLRAYRVSWQLAGSCAPVHTCRTEMDRRFEKYAAVPPLYRFCVYLCASAFLLFYIWNTFASLKLRLEGKRKRDSSFALITLQPNGTGKIFSFSTFDWISRIKNKKRLIESRRELKILLFSTLYPSCWKFVWKLNSF